MQTLFAGGYVHSLQELASRPPFPGVHSFSHPGIIGTGATRHMLADVTELHNFQSQTRMWISGLGAYAIWHATVAMDILAVDNTASHVTLRNVLLVPDIIRKSDGYVSRLFCARQAQDHDAFVQVPMTANISNYMRTGGVQSSPSTVPHGLAASLSSTPGSTSAQSQPRILRTRPL